MGRRYKSKFNYIVEQAIWIVFSLWIFRKFLFRLVDGWSYRESVWFLTGCLVLCCLSGLTNDMACRRTEAGIFYNLFLAYGLYTCVVYFFAYQKYILVLCGMAFVITALCIAAIFSKKSDKEQSSKKYLVKKLQLSIYACRKNFSVAMFILMVFISGRIVFSGSVAGASFEVVNAYGEDYTLSNNIETIAKIRDEEWKELSFQEKVDVAQAIAYCEGNYLGLPNKLTVEVGDLEERTLGGYNDDTYRIFIDTEHMKNSSGADVLRTILHECYHCYQRRCVEIYQKLEPEERNLLLFHKMPAYMEEFENYVSGYEDEDSYYSQQIEKDARSYSILQAEEYARRIEEELAKATNKRSN